MTVTLTPSPKQKFFDNNGAPASQYKLFTNQAGTSTKLATYVDSAGVTQNTNPIILDFRGECNLWIPPNVAYKYVLASPADSDPPGNPLWTIDNIVSSQLVTLYGGVDTGIANAYILNFTANFTSYTDGIVIYWIPSRTNTGASTINVNGLGVVNILNPDGTPLYLGELVANQFAAIIFSGGSFKLFAFGFLPKINLKNSDYTFALSDSQGILVSNGGGGPFTWTIPSDAAANFPIGTSIDLVNYGSAIVNVTGSGVTFTGYNTTANSLVLQPSVGATRIIKVAVNYWVQAWISNIQSSNSFTGTLTGMTVATTGTIAYTKNLGLVTLTCVAGLNGTSNSTNCSLTGLPAEIQPTAGRFVMCSHMNDNGAQALVEAQILGGTVTFSRWSSFTALAAASFTAAGTKGFPPGWTMVYPL